jgi:hypothetical protein
MTVMDTESEIQQKLQTRIDSVTNGSSLDSVDASVRGSSVKNFRNEIQCMNELSKVETD